MESHRVKSLNDDKGSRRTFRFETGRQKSKRASADVYRKYKRRVGVTSAATREENVHHTKSPRPSKRFRTEENEPTAQSNESQALDIVSDETTLASELELALDRNPSEVFKAFHRELWPLVRSLPEQVHHAEKIVEIMLRYMLSPDGKPEGKSTAENLFEPTNLQGEDLKRYEINHATTDIFHLLAVMARDLRHEIHPWLHTRILPRIVGDLLNQPLPSSGKQPIPIDVTIVEAAFRTIAYLLRYDSEMLIAETSSKQGEQPCLEPMRKYYGATLANRRELVRRLAAETFAPLIRRLKSDSSKKRHLRRVLRALDASASKQTSTPSTQRLNEDAVDGVAQLCVELIKGVGGDFNSKGDFVINCVLSSITGQTDEQSKLLVEVASSFFSRLMTFLKPQKAARLIFEVKTHLSQLKSQDERRRKHNDQSVRSFARLACEILSRNEGVFVSGHAEKDAVKFIIQEITDVVLAGTLSTDVEESLAKLVRAAWTAFEGDEDSLAFLNNKLALLLGVECGDTGGKDAVRSVSTSFRDFVARHVFSSLPLDSAMRDVGSLLLKSASMTQNADECLRLVHGVSCFRSNIHDPLANNDDIFFPENARLCEVSPSLVSSLLDRFLVPCENVPDNIQMLLAATRCAAFLAACATDRAAFERSFKKVALWLANKASSVGTKTEEKSQDSILLFSSAVEALARLSSIALDRGVSSETVDSQLMRIRDVAEKILIRCPTSPSLLKSCALLCKSLGRLSKHLSDDSNPIFEMLHQNLNSPSHFKRKHSLEIMASFPKKPFVVDHADLDLSGDLDEEPSSFGVGEKINGPTGVCDIIDTLLKAESLPVDLSSERPMASLLSRVEIFGRTRKLPLLYADAAASHLMGLLHVKFSPVWKPAIKTLAVIATVHDQSSWPVIFGKLTELMEYGDSDEEGPEKNTPGQASTQPSGFDVDAHFSANKVWENSGGTSFALFSGLVGAANEAGKVSAFEYRALSDVLRCLWELFEAEPMLVVGHSRDMVTLVLRFMKNYSMEEVRINAQSDESKDTNRSIVDLRRREQEQRLLSILKVFAVLRGPEQLVLHRNLYRIFVALLEHHDEEVVKLAVECVLRFKPDFLLPSAETVKQILSKGKFRDAMITLRENAVSGKILPSHRQELSPFLARILTGRLSAKSGSKSAKDSPSARRTAVFSFAAGFCATDDELFPFLWLAFRRYVPGGTVEKPMEEFNSDDRENLQRILSCLSPHAYQQLPFSMHEGALNCFEPIVEQLGHRVLNFVPCLLAVVLGLLETFQLKNSGPEPMLQDDENVDEPSKTVDRAGRVRSLCQLRLAEIFDKFANSFDFSPFCSRVWKCLDRALELLPQLTKSAGKPPALLQLLVVVSRNEKLRGLLLSNDKAIRAVLSCLSQSTTFSVIDAVLTFIENVIEMANEDDGDDLLWLYKLIPTLLEHFELRLKDFGTTMTWKRELCILSKVSDLSKNITAAGGDNDKEFDSLAMLLVPFLGFKSKSSDKDRLHILDVLRTIIPRVSVDTAHSLYATFSTLLGPFRSTPGLSNTSLRHRLACSYGILGDVHMKEAKMICKVIESLCAVNTRVIDELDADKVVTALKELRNKDGTSSWSGLLKSGRRRRYLDPVIRSCFHFLFNDDGVVARASFYALKDFIERIVFIDQEISEFMDQAEELSWERFFEQSLVPLIRSGMTSRSSDARRYFILLVADVAKVCRETQSPHLPGDLSVLISESEPDLDFFLNITHVQIHRRSRALGQLRKNFLTEKSAGSSFSVQSLSGILLPIVLHPIYESTTNLDESLALEAIATLATLARLFPWKKFQDELWTLLTQVERHPLQEQYIIGAICAMISGFHFDVGNPYSTENGDTQGTSAWNALENRIVPKLETLFTKEKDKGGQKIKQVRPQVILCLAELYKKLPEGILERKLPRLITVLSDALKSRDSTSRDLARNTMAKLAVLIGVSYLPDILRELAITLKEGYQLHVRGAAVHSILLNMWETSFSTSEISTNHAIDASIAPLMDLVQQDLFGVAQTRKDDEFNQVRLVKESGGSKSLHSLELMAGMINLDRGENKSEETRRHETVYGLVSPLLTRMQLENQTPKQLRLLKECLGRVVQGLSKNKDFTSKGILPLTYVTIEPCMRRDNMYLLEGEQADGESRGEVVEWRPSSLGMAKTASAALDDKRRAERADRKALDGSQAPKLTGSWRNVPINPTKKSLDDPSSIAAVLFGLQLLRFALRKGIESEAREQLSPFVPLLTECICKSRDSEAILLAMRCLGDIRAMVATLPAFDSSSEVLASKTLDFLVGYGGNEELLQASFRLMAYLIEGNKKKRNGTLPESSEQALPFGLSEEQMELLLSFVQTSLMDATWHNPAMNLVKALVEQEVISPGMYDLMAVVLKQSIQSHKETLRQKCSVAYINFLMTYPMTTGRMEKELKQLVVNMQFEGVEGRYSAISMVKSVLKKFPDPVIVKHCQLFFVPLTMQLGNDESEKCKRGISECLSTLLSRLPAEAHHPLLEYALTWGRSADPSLKRVAFSVLGIFVDSCDTLKNVESKLNEVLLLANEALYTEGDWELLYFTLILLEKIYKRSPKAVASHLELWRRIVSCLAGFHPWVGLVSLRLLLEHLNLMVPTSFVEDQAVSFLQKHGNLFILLKSLCSFLDTDEEEQNDDAVALVIKALTWSLKAANRYPELCFDEGVYQIESKNPVRWLMTRLSNIAKPKGRKRRQAIFKCFAAFAQYGDGIVFDFLELVIEPLYRAEREIRNESENAVARGRAPDNITSEESQLAKDVLHLLEQLCTPHDRFVDALGAVKKEAQAKKAKRTQEARSEAARDPKAAAIKKDAKHAREKERRKRRIDDRRDARGGKARRRYN